MKKTMVVGLLLIALGIILSGIGFLNGGVKAITQENGKTHIDSSKDRFEIQYEFGNN